MFKRRTTVAGLLLALAGAVVPALVTAAPANAAVPDFRFGIRLIDNGGRSEEGPLQQTPSLASGGGLAAFAFDANRFDPDGAQLALLTTTGIPTDLDFRICGQAFDDPDPGRAKVGPVRCSPWAGGGFSPYAFDLSFFDPDGFIFGIAPGRILG